MKWCIITLLLLASFGTTTAAACSVPHAYRVPTTIELVEQADVIVLARVSGSHRDRETGLTLAELMPFSVLKGDFLPVSVSLDDAILANRKYQATASDPRNIVEANPDALTGGCRRQVFKRGAIVLAFLREKNGAYMAYSPAFSRALEDVPSADALWVKAVKVYIEIAAVPIAQRREEIQSKIEQLSRDLNDPDARLLILELRRSLVEDF